MVSTILVGAAIFILWFILFLMVCRNRGLIEMNREIRRSQSHLLDYVEILHDHGVGSQVALEFKEEHCYDPILMRRMRVMDHIFTMKERMWEGQKRSGAQDKLARLVDVRNRLGEEIID